MLAYALLGLVAGLLAGIFGIGGGLILVPALLHLLPGALQTMHYALGSAFACILLSGSISAWTHYRHGAVQRAWLIWLAPGLLSGTLLGSTVASATSSNSLQRLFGIFELLIALRLLTARPAPAGATPRPTPRLQLASVGGGIGFVSAFLGIGGGTLTTPYLLWRGTDLRRAIGTAAAGGVPIALAGTTGYSLASGAGPAAWSSGYVYWPAVGAIVLTSLPAAYWGATLAQRLPLAWLQRGFALLLAGLGLHLLLWM